MTKPILPAEPTPPEKKQRGRPRIKVPGDSLYLALNPTSGQDLMAMWELRPEAWEEGRLKINQLQPMTSTQALVATMTIAAYDMAQVAAQYGPGTYTLILSPNAQQLWGTKTARVNISPEFARTSGYQTFREPAPPPIPRMAEVNSFNAVTQSLNDQKPITTGDLLQFVEVIAERMKPAPAPALPGGGMGFEQAMAFYATMDRMREQAEEKAVARMQTILGRDVDPPETSVEESWPSMLAKALPGILSAFAPKPLSPAQPAPLPQNEEEILEDPQPMDTLLTLGEKTRFAAPVAMLSHFVPQILDMMAAEPDDAVVGSQLATYVPGPLATSLRELATIAGQRGPAVVGYIHPALATPRGLAVLKAIASHLQAQA